MNECEIQVRKCSSYNEIDGCLKWTIKIQTNQIAVPLQFCSLKEDG